MKPNLNSKKLTLKKNTVSHLKITEMKTAKGGITGFNCDTINTCYLTFCPSPFTCN